MPPAAPLHDACCCVCCVAVLLHQPIHPHSALAQIIQSPAAIIWDQLFAVNRTTLERRRPLPHDLCNRPRIPLGGVTLIGLGIFRRQVQLSVEQERLRLSQRR
ncbi:hypothetical protein BDR04DRAFT_1097975 [Suillus decipiens]|nr:hypothetical protein BDR04DRAFT_1097975 [Suillus decipiens]